MSDYLPPQLIHNILLRVPVRTLFTCSTVCKSWKSLIESPEFVKNHIDSHLLLLKAATTDEATIELYLLRNPENGESTKLINPCSLFEPLQPFLEFHIIGTCNGLICISAKHKESASEITLLWNPCIRKYVTLPSPTVSVTSNDAVDYAFGYDWHTNDYKVLRFKILKFDLPEREVEIYSLARGCWKSVSDANVPRGYLDVDNLVFVHGAVHWFQCESGIGGVGFANFISSFDMFSEQFGELLLPQALAEQDHGIRISRYFGALACVSMPCAQGDTADIHIWAMTEYGVLESWTKLFTVPLDLEGIPSIVLLKPFGIRRNGEVMIDVYGKGLLSLDNETAQAKIISEYDGFMWHCFVDSYVESRVLLGKANAVSY